MTANSGFANGSRTIRLTFPIQRDHASTMLDATWSIFHVLEEAHGLMLTHCTKRLRVYVMALDDGRGNTCVKILKLLEAIKIILKVVVVQHGDYFPIHGSREKFLKSVLRAIIGFREISGVSARA